VAFGPQGFVAKMVFSRAEGTGKELLSRFFTLLLVLVVTRGGAHRRSGLTRLEMISGVLPRKELVMKELGEPARSRGP
jgi:hypothetical protein